LPWFQVKEVLVAGGLIERASLKQNPCTCAAAGTVAAKVQVDIVVGVVEFEAIAVFVDNCNIGERVERTVRR
jgi:hypothetical protein